MSLQDKPKAYNSFKFMCVGVGRGISWTCEKHAAVPDAETAPSCNLSQELGDVEMGRSDDEQLVITEFPFHWPSSQVNCHLSLPLSQVTVTVSASRISDAPGGMLGFEHPVSVSRDMSCDFNLNNNNNNNNAFKF